MYYIPTDIKDQVTEVCVALDNNYNMLVKPKLFDDPKKRVYVAYGEREEVLKRYTGKDAMTFGDPCYVKTKIDKAQAEFEKSLASAEEYIAKFNKYAQVIGNLLALEYGIGTRDAEKMRKSIPSPFDMMSDRRDYLTKFAKYQTGARIVNMFKTHKFYAENLINLYIACELDVAKTKDAKCNADALFLKNLEALSSIHLDRFGFGRIIKFDGLNNFCAICMLSPEQICGQNEVKVNGMKKRTNFLLVNSKLYTPAPSDEFFKTRQDDFSCAYRPFTYTSLERNLGEKLDEVNALIEPDRSDNLKRIIKIGRQVYENLPTSR